MATEFDLKVTSLKRKLADAYNELQSIVDFSRNAVQDPTKVPTFKGVFRTLEKYFEKYESTYDDLVDHHFAVERSAEFPTKKDLEHYTNAKRYYKQCLVNYEVIIKAEADEAAAAAAARLPSRVVNPGNITVTPETRSSNLPRISIPKFDGQYTAWPKFRDMFSSLVHRDDTLSNMEKFHYLLSSLSGNAAAVISHLAMEEGNYVLAWQSLLDTYDKKRLLANSYLNHVLQFKPHQGKPNSKDLLRYLSSVTDAISALKLLNIADLSEFILFFLAFRNLDSHTKEQFEFANKNVDFPTFTNLVKFVREKCVALQLSEGNIEIESSHSSHSSYIKNKDFHNRGKQFKNSDHFKQKTTLLASESKEESKSPNSRCPICDNSHTLLNCSDFYNLTPQERSNRLRNWQGCKNCLNSQHFTSKCRSKWHCRFCPQRHNSLLHFHSKGSANQSTNDDLKNEPNLSRSSNVGSSLQCHHVSACPETSSVQVILGTAWANFVDIRGQIQRFRIAIDSGSQQSFITSRCVNKLGLSMFRCDRKISSLGGSLFDGAKGKTACVIRSKDLSNVFTTDAVVVSNITNHLPTSPVPYDVWRHFIGFELADPKFWEPTSIDFLLGADLYGDVMNGTVTSVRDDLPKLFDSAFGHIVMGRYKEPHASTNFFSSICLFSPNVQDDNLNFELSKFWELEEPASYNQTQNPEHVKAEEFFANNHYRQEDGRYVVRLPFKEPNVEFPTSYSIAKRRFENLESKLKRNPSLSLEYHKFMDEYIKLGHMQKTSKVSKFVIPHHCVTKEDRGEVKLRVVFDGSVRTRNGSLNDSLLIGPPLQTDIRDILLNFRRHAIVFVADAVKMYRQILVHPSDRAYQHIVWRFDSSDAVQTYELSTVTYGLSCAPFLALRTLRQLVNDERSSFPLAAEVLSRDIFVDDLATGAPTISEALTLQNEIVALMHRGGFALSKWASNHPAILETVSGGSFEAPINTSVTWSDNETTAIKVLGLKWDPVNDVFSYQMKPPTSTVSKRAILSTVARIFDPLGFISPCTFLMKGFVQELWKLKLGWDDPVSDDLTTDWNDIVQQLELLSQIKIPRFAFSNQPFEYQIIGFADASQKGYCAALYIRVITAHNTHSHLLISKTKLAPIKVLSIPRLELCGALLLAKLYKSIRGFISNLPPTMHPNRFFSDSTIVLSWLKTPTYRLKTFVAHRVGQIAELTDVISWSHVDSENNPSDIGSRGSLPIELLDNTLWWSGPSWLKLPENEWPNYTSKIDEDLPELKPTSTSVLFSTKSGSQETLNWMSRISSYCKLIRVAAILLRAIHNRKNKQSLRTGVLKHSELHEAESNCIKLIQRLHFFKGSNPKTSDLEDKFPGLKPYLDIFGVARVGGRLSKSSIPENQKHPILLPNKSHFTNLLVDHYHTLFLHPGPNLNQALLQTRFWIPAARRLIRQRLFLCLKCYKAKAKSIPPLMGDLPTYRLEGGRAFLHTGVDFAGPFTTRESLRRKAPLNKSYLCLYVCMTTKALHLETVSDLSTSSFLASFSRFISRRGLPSEMYSDCGSNFKGASKELQELEQWFNDEKTKRQIDSASSSRGIKWNFNPPYSPHFGGLWEAGVKAVKRHLYLAAGNVPLTFEELTTLFCRIEAILNSRPLCPLSSDPSEFDFLSPGHFLIGGPLSVNPEPTLLDVEDNRLDRWQLNKKISDQVWKRWHLEYVSTLQARSKWRKPSANLEVGDLVIIKDSSAPQLEWPTARVSDIHPGSDGIVRVVTLRTSSATYKRSVANLIPLLPLKTSAHPSDP